MSINPCENCLVSVNCTCVCDKKLNSRTIIRRAYEQHRDYKMNPHLPRRSEINKLFERWRNLLWETNEDISKIKIRAMKLRDPDGMDLDLVFDDIEFQKGKI